MLTKKQNLMENRIVITIMMTGKVNVLSINLTYINLYANNNDIKRPAPAFTHRVTSRDWSFLSRSLKGSVLFFYSINQ